MRKKRIKHVWWAVVDPYDDLNADVYATKRKALEMARRDLRAGHHLGGVLTVVRLGVVSKTEVTASARDRDKLVGR